MKVEKNKVVALSYTLVVDGAVADSASEQKPLEYIHGTGMLLPRFEEEVAGKEPGQEYAFTLSPEEGYGVHDPRQVIDIPLAAFMIDGEVRRDLLVVGRTIPMMNQDGHVLQGTVAAVKEDSVSMDFNHPMAGKTLTFSDWSSDVCSSDLAKWSPCVKPPTKNSPKGSTVNTSPAKRAAARRKAANVTSRKARTSTSAATARARAKAAARTNSNYSIPHPYKTSGISTPNSTAETKQTNPIPPSTL